MTDSRHHAESKTLQVGPCARAVSSLYGGESLLSLLVTYCPLLAPSIPIRAASHATRAPCRSLAVPKPRSCSWKCGALLEIIHIIRCKSFVGCQVVLCVLSQEQIGREHVCIEYTQKVLKVVVLSTPKEYYCAGKMLIHYFSGHFFCIPGTSTYLFFIFIFRMIVVNSILECYID